jgi:hypothetical protein
LYILPAGEGCKVLSTKPLDDVAGMVHGWLDICWQRQSVILLKISSGKFVGGASGWSSFASDISKAKSTTV